MSTLIGIVCIACFFVTFALVLFRVFLQIRGGILLKKYQDFWGKIGIDKVLFLAPEFAPVKTYDKIVADEKNAEITRYWKSLKIYKFSILICLILWCIVFIF